MHQKLSLVLSPNLLVHVSNGIMTSGSAHSIRPDSISGLIL